MSHEAFHYASLEEVRQTAEKLHAFLPLEENLSVLYEPLIAYRCPPLEEGLEQPFRVLTDDELRRYEDAFETTAGLSQQAGFDGMDVKCCHRYLACELLSAYTRPGAYGGCYENRTRFLKNAFRAAHTHFPSS